jgi:hypothetical protein
VLLTGDLICIKIMETQNQIPSVSQDKYIPGVCNIGTEEIRRRRNGALFFGAITAIEIILLRIFDVSQIWRLTLFIPATSLGIGFQQWYLKFCVGFGLKGVFNFEEIGKTYSIEQKENLKKDRKKVRQMIWVGIGFGLLTAILFYLF